MLVTVIIGLWIREFLLTQPVTWNTLLNNGSYRPCGKKGAHVLIGLISTWHHKEGDAHDSDCEGINHMKEVDVQKLIWSKHTIV